MNHAAVLSFVVPVLPAAGRPMEAPAPVRPGSTLSIDLTPEPGAARGLRFEVRCGDVVAVSGRWTPAS